MGRTLLAPISFGLGDLVVSLPALQALIARDESVWLVARAPSQRLLADRVEGLAGVVDERGLRCRPGDCLIDLRDHPLQRDYWWGSPEFEAAFGRLDINQILSRIGRDFGIHADYTRPLPLVARARPGLDQTVLLVHETDGTDKRWPAEQWAAVAGALESKGLRVAQVTRGTEPSPLDQFGIPTVRLSTPGDAVDALTACRGVIGVDTGLTHIAVQQGTPTVTLCRSNSVYFRPWAHCRALRGGGCTDECVAADAEYAYNERISLHDFRPPPRRCPSGSPCLAGLLPGDAVALLGEML